MGFQGAVWSPPPLARVGWALFAALFDKIAIVCYKDTCSGQVEAYPSSIQDKIVLLDSDQINGALGIGSVDDHGYKVTQGHAAAWDLLTAPGVSNVLILEDDYRLMNATVDVLANGTEHSATLRGIADLVRSSDWGLLRLGYNPLMQEKHLDVCRQECNCVPSHQTPSICSVALPLDVATKHCDVRSFVGYAVQKSLYPVLSAYAHAAFDNYTNYFGQLMEARENYHGPDDAKGYTETPQDLYFPATIAKIHYFTPGFVYQEAKPAQVVEMTSFSRTCNKAAAATPIMQAAEHIPAFITNATQHGSIPITKGTAPTPDSSVSHNASHLAHAHHHHHAAEPHPSPAAAAEVALEALQPRSMI